jgi:two-component system chemotaxis sensor kinase CheA
MVEGLDREVLAQLVDCLVEEAEALLGHTETSVLKLESRPNDVTLVQEIFRAVHTLKGSSASLGFAELASFAHEVESLLAEIKMGRKVTPTLVGVLLKCIDAFRGWFNLIRAGESGKSYDPSVAVNALRQLCEVEAKVGALNPPTKSEPQIPPPMAEPDIIFMDEVSIPETKDPAPTQPSPEGHVSTSSSERPSDDEADSKSDGNELVTLPLRKIETLLDLFGEQVILHSLLENVKDDLSQNAEMAKKTINQLSKITHQLQNAAMSLRMVSLRAFFVKMQRTVRDTSSQLGKSINLVVEGEDTELDKHMVDKLSGFATHLVRNSIDHGIEASEVRQAAGKSPQGNIELRAYIHGGFFYLEIKDDGQGINRARVKEKALRQGIIKDAERLSDADIINLIFHPGFSTKEQATEISGRGFGMDIVIHDVTRMHGSITLESVEGQNTRVVVRLPLTMAIFNGIVVKVGKERFIIPSSEVQDISRVAKDKCVSVASGENLVEIKSNMMPLIPIQRAVRFDSGGAVAGDSKRPSDDRTVGIAIEVTSKNKPYALLVDELIGLQRVVLKNLGKEVRNCPGVSGGAVLPDGSVALVLETDKVVDLYEQNFK